MPSQQYHGSPEFACTDFQFTYSHLVPRGADESAGTPKVCLGAWYTFSKGSRRLKMSTTVVLSAQIPSVRGPSGQPDIGYAPDFQKYQVRSARRVQAEKLASEVPEGFPKELKGDPVWEGETIGKTYDWTFVLSPEHLAEIEVALKHFQSLGLILGHINQETFPLPILHAELRRLSSELHHGHGFFVIRGLEVDRHSREENIIIYAGISSHIAAQRGRQDLKYEGKPASVVMMHIKDLSKTTVDGVIGSPAYTTDKQVFHTDTGDIISLFALEIAAEGGASKLASTGRVYNELARTRPDLIHTLSQDWAVDIFDRTNPDRKYMLRPLLYHQPATDSNPERVALQYTRRYLVGYGALQRSPDIPPLTEAQAEALDAVHFLGEKFHVSTNFQKGDIQYINNLALFHARDGFTDTREQQ
ncbi:Taurine hydroxylase-like protein SAT17 [Paramyrothecium foliicola]|nr:Taurine hydroxylase-like protein SAT17 [Paramyrothecium foliicola]